MQYLCETMGHYGTVAIDLPFDDPAYPHCPACQRPMSKTPPLPFTTIEPSGVSSTPFKESS